MSKLAILPDEPYHTKAEQQILKLRDDSPFLEFAHTKTQPRSLRALAQIIDNGLCHRCGTCVGICPTKVLAKDEEEYPVVADLDSCTDCDLCVRVCPGVDFDYIGEFKAKFKREPKLTETHGYYEKALIGYANNPEIRKKGTSGGIITQMLITLLERGEIDGAIVVSSSETLIWAGSSKLALTKEEIISAAKSKYALTATNSALGELRNLPDTARFAVVGLPCQVHGIIKAKSLDKKLAAKIPLVFGLFCHASIEHQAYRVMFDMLDQSVVVRAKSFVTRLGKHPGGPHIRLDDGTDYPVYYPDKSGYRPNSMEIINILYRLYTPERCLTCFDGLSEFADIAVGDPWFVPPEGVDFHDGWSFILARTQNGLDYLSKVEEAGTITLQGVSEYSAKTCNRMMATEKRWRAFRTIETLKRQGKSIPEYHLPKTPPSNLRHFIETEFHVLSHIFCYLPRARDKVLRFMLSKGYYLLWLNNLRRKARYAIKRVLAKLNR